MAIETMDEWNANLSACGCCNMPTCPTPILEVEQKSFDHPICAVSNPSSAAIPCEDFCKVWRKKTLTVVRDLTVTTNSSVPAPPNGCGSTTTHTETSHREDVTDDENAYTPDESGGATCVSTRVETHEGSYTEIFDTTATTGTPPPAEPCEDFTLSTETEDSTANRTTVGVSITSQASTFDHVLTVVDNSGTTTPIDVHCSTATFTGCARASSAPTGGAGTIMTTWDGTTLTSTTTFPNGTETSTTTMSDPVTVALLETEADAALALQSFVAASSGTYLVASTDIDRTSCTGEEQEDCVTNYDRINGRYRWRIPSSHAGDLFVLEWDEVFFPTGWDSVGYAGPPPTVTPKTYTWTGPANPSDPNDPSWFSPFSSEISVSGGDRGTLEIRNLRYVCYGTTPYGAPFPQTDGPIYEPS